MRLFEFNFNPNAKSELVFESFCFTPENLYERRLGSLFIIGELKNTLPQNLKLLDKIALAIKKEFYKKFQRKTELALKEALRQGNELLSAEVSRNNTTWLGNLSFAILSLKNYELNFTKIGGIEIFLLRGPHVIDIGSKLDNQEIEPYPLKVFNNIVSGGLAENDILLVITPEILPIFKGIMDDIAKIHPFNEKQFSQLLKTKSKEVTSFSGSCVLAVLDKDESPKNPKLVFQKEPEAFSFSKMFAPAKTALETAKKPIKFFLRFKDSLMGLKDLPKKAKTFFLLKKPKAKTSKAKSVKRPKIRAPKISISIPKLRLPHLAFSGFKLPHFNLPKFPSFSFSFSRPVFGFTSQLKKGANLLAILVVLMVIGFFVFQNEERQKTAEYLEVLNTAKEKITLAESFLILKDTKPDAALQANSLLLEAWDLVLPLTKINSPVQENALLIKKMAEENLANLNNLIKIDEPELVFEFNANGFIPSKIVSGGLNNYFFSSLVNDIFAIDENKNGRTLGTTQKFNSAASSDQNILFFTKPNKITAVRDGQISENFLLKDPYLGFDFADFSSFSQVLYFLDSKNGEVIRYPALPEGKDNPQLWLYRNTPGVENGKSLAVDGSVWILNGENKILKYYFGQLEKTIVVNIFPAPKNFSKILITPSLPYIFISEPIQKRILVLKKDGSIFKQFQCDKFDNILDFSVSDDGKTVWVLNGLMLYKFNI